MTRLVLVFGACVALITAATEPAAGQVPSWYAGRVPWYEFQHTRRVAADSISADSMLILYRYQLSPARQVARSPWPAGYEGDVATLDVRAMHKADLPLTYELDFGDGSVVSTNTGGAFQHRYMDDPEGHNDTVVVRATVSDPVGRSASWVTLFTLFNEAPVVQRAWYDGSQEVGSTLTFQAEAKDASPADTIMYRWDFGDGTETNPSEDPVARHAYAKEGAYDVTLTVEDDDPEHGPGEVDYPLLVIIGEGAAFRSTGDVVIPESDATETTVMGVPLDDGSCQVSIHLLLPDEGTVTLQAILPDGVTPGSVGVRPATEFAGSWTQNQGTRGRFTSYFGATHKHDPPDRALFGFRSQRGEIRFGAFDGRMVTGIFEIVFKEDTAFPDPADATVTGYFRLPVSNRFMGPGAIRDHFYACPVRNPPP